jgi:RND superfamily putative drug exporter
MAKLVHGAERLDYGLDRLATGSRKLSVGIGRLSEGGGKLAPGLDQLSKGAEKLEGGLGEIAKGSGALAGGLGGGAQKSKLLSGALQKIHGGIERRQGDPGSSPLDDLRQQSPGLFRSGYFYLASLDGAKPRRRGQAGFLVSVDRGGSAARMLVIPRYDPSDPRARETRDRLAADAADLARDTGTQVVVGGVTSNQLDIDGALRAQTPLARLALALMTIIILIPVVRSLIVPLLAALLNLVTVAATFGVLALLFDDSLLGGPGYVETTVLPATIMVVFGLAIDYEVFVFSRIREEYLRSGSTDAAVANGLARIAPVVTGAAMIMIVVFLSFAASSFTTMREFGIAQAVGVFIDAFVVRLIVVPAMMRALGDRAWWMPRWLDRLLPGTPNASNWTLGEA